METEEIMNENTVSKRPVFLTVLCILSFISSGLGSITALLTPLFADTIIEFLQNAPGFDETQMYETIQVLQAGWGFYAITFLLAVGSFIGVFFMWNLRKTGFHFYAISNLGLLLTPMLLFGMPTNWTSIFFTASFILLYAINLKYMK